MRLINYSIIIPHKNTPDLLQYCLDSIPVRDDVQVIVVDDNSDSGKVDFGHFPLWHGKNYEYYLTKEGKGAGYARNVALDHAVGKWLMFVDADDFLLPEAGDIFDEEKDTDADMIYFRTKAVQLSDRKTPAWRGLWQNRMMDRYFAIGDETELRCELYTATNRFIRREMIERNHIRFEEIQYSNDNLFAIEIGVNAEKIVVRNKSVYCITSSSDTLTSNYLKKPGEVRIRADAFFRTQDVLLQHGYPLTEHTALFWLCNLLTEDRQAFRLYFNRVRSIKGYKKSELIKKLFKGSGRKARIWRSIYAYVLTAI